jgi:hypothetical protein
MYKPIFVVRILPYQSIRVISPTDKLTPVGKKTGVCFTQLVGKSIKFFDQNSD